MKKFTIACLPGDGPGPMVMGGITRALTALQSHQAGFDTPFAMQFEQYPMGLEALQKTGSTLPDASLQAISSADAALLGMIDIDAEHADSAIGPMRRKLMLYADVRPVKPLGAAWSLRPDIDLVCIRESTEGFLADRNMHKGSGEMMPSEDVVISMRVLTRTACTRLAEFAFRYARANNRKKITVVHKANVLKMGCGFFLDIVRQTAAAYPEITVDDAFVDTVAHQLIAAPEQYDILLMTNLMGDILSDEASALVSGMTGSANIGDTAAVFFPVNHLVDSKKDEGNAVNPVPLFLCAALMLRHLGLHQAAGIFEQAITNAAFEPDGRTASAEQFINAVCEGVG